MLDIASPRLVGQALYEGIRWARSCIVDWTDWRANVFFEFGVRLACAKVGPIIVIDQAGAPEAQQTGTLMQRSLLGKLFMPTVYLPGEDFQSLHAAFKAHDATLLGAPPPAAGDQLPGDATYWTCEEAFDWAQEGLTAEPHDALRRSVQEPFGNDPQAAGRAPVLFSTNPAFSRELERSVKERWLAAWYYLSQRHPRASWAADGTLRSSLRRLCNEVLQYGLRDSTEPHLLALRETLFDVIDDLDKLDKGPP
jgi:hypothetical protein